MKLVKASSLGARLRGLLATPHLAADTGLYLPGCRSIHTLGMTYAIDVLFVDKHGCVLKRIDALPPWRVAASWRAYGVVELPAGYCAEHPDYAYRVSEALRRTTSKRH